MSRMMIPDTVPPLRPHKKRKVTSIEASLPTHGTTLDTPLKGSSDTNNSRLVTPSLREPSQEGEIDKGFGSYLEFVPPVSMQGNGMTSNKICTQQEKPISISPVQKENLSNRDLSPRVSVKEKGRDELKAILLRNGQSVTGSVQVLQTRVADGEAYGKLSLCPRCNGGKLKISTENSRFVYCSRKTLCGFQCATLSAPRAGPWNSISFDDDQDATSPNAAPATTTTNVGSSTGRQTGGDRRRLSPQPTPYWSGHHPILPNLPPVQHGFGPQGQYPYYYPPQFGFPNHHRQPFYPLHTGYAPIPLPHVPENFGSYQTNPRMIPPIASNQNRESMGQENGWFPFSDPASFPDRGAVSIQRPPASNEAGGGQHPPSHKMHHQSVGNYTPAEVSMATEAAKKALGTQQTEGNKKQWSAEEDEIVRDAVTSSRTLNFNAWTSLVPILPGRKGKQIRDRWVNHLNPMLLHTPFDEEDDLRLWNAVAKFGTSWKEISIRQFYSKRSENTIKNRWHSVPFRKFIAQYVGPKEYERAIEKLKKGSSDY